jgi:hypothetical protein
MGTSIWLRSPTTTIVNWSGVLYFCATRCTASAVTVWIRSMNEL